MRIFCDVDDTLVFWTKNGNGNPMVGSDWRANQDLIDLIYTLGDNPDNEVIVWSGGGKPYAELWARRFFPDLEWQALDKVNNLGLPEKGDLVIDDMELETKGLCMTWQKAVKVYGQDNGLVEE